MSMTLSQNAWRALRCPQCSQELRRIADGAECGACATRYPATLPGALDLRLQKPRKVTLAHMLGGPPAVPERIDWRELREKRDPEVDFSGVPVPYHLTRELMSHFPRARGAGDLALDLGCGAALHRAACEKAGFEYVGLDHASAQAQILGDAHALPFADASMGFVLSIAVLEHLRHPFVAMREVCRVLRPGAPFIGTVAFLEPFHSDSYFHHSHLGVLTSLREGGLEVERIAPSADWHALAAQGAMGLFPRLPNALLRPLLWPLHALHRLWWAAGGLVNAQATEATRVRNLTGAFSFVARRPLQGAP